MGLGEATSWVSQGILSQSIKELRDDRRVIEWVRMGDKRCVKKVCVFEANNMRLNELITW